MAEHLARDYQTSVKWALAGRRCALARDPVSLIARSSRRPDCHTPAAAVALPRAARRPSLLPSIACSLERLQALRGQLARQYGEAVERVPLLVGDLQDEVRAAACGGRAAVVAHLLTCSGRGLLA